MQKAGKDSCEDMKEMNFLILGMHCASCAASVERAVKKMDGVTKVYVNLATKTMTLSAEESVTPGMIIERVTDSGFHAQLIEDRRQTREDEEAGGRYFLRFLTALIFSILLFYAAMSGMLGLPYPPIPPLANAFVQIALLIPVLLAGCTFYLYGFRTLAKLSPNMDSLIALGTSAAILYSVYLIVRGDFEHLYFDTAGMIIALIMLGKFLEAEEPIGRKMDFLVQEINREANTIGSKASDVAIAGKVIDIKAEVEKIREQIQNIE